MLHIGPSNPKRLLRVFEALAVGVMLTALLIGVWLVDRKQQAELAEARDETSAQIERAAFEFQVLFRRILPWMHGTQLDPHAQTLLKQEGSGKGFETLLAGMLYRNPVVQNLQWLNPQGMADMALQKQGARVENLLSGSKPAQANLSVLHPFEPAQLQQLKHRDHAAALQHQADGQTQLWLASPWVTPDGATQGYLLISTPMPRLDLPPFRLNNHGLALEWFDTQGQALNKTHADGTLPKADPGLWTAIQNAQTHPDKLWQRVVLSGQDFNGLTLKFAPDVWVVGSLDVAKLARRNQQDLINIALICLLGALGTLIALYLSYRLLDHLQSMRRLDARIRRVAGMGYWQFDVNAANFTASADVWRAQGLLDHAHTPVDAKLFTLERWLEGFGNADRDRFFAEIERISNQEGQFELEVLYRTLKDEEVWISIRGQSDLRDPKQPRIEGSIQNVTARKNAELARESIRDFLESVMDLSQLAVFEIDVTTDLRRCNKHLFGLLGLPFDQDKEFQTLDFDALVHPDDLPGMLEQRRGYVDGKIQIYRMPIRVKHADGHWVWLYGQGKVVARDAQGHALLIRGIIMDISEIAKAREEAESALRAKSEFLSRMSHELRTPLNGILGYAQMLEHYGELNEHQREHVHSIMGGGRHLLSLVNDLLEISRAQDDVHRTLDIRPLPLGKTVTYCCDMVLPQAQDRGMRLVQDLNDGQYVQADGLRIKQVILNLLSNAIKYGDPDTQVVVSTRRLGNGMLRLSVRNSGPGIAPEVGSKVFEAFYRGELHGFGYEGAGIGLLVSKQLVESMRGRISFESTVGQYTVFHVDLPVAATSTAEGRLSAQA